MLTSVEIQTAEPMVLNIESVDPDEILVIKSISGLAPAGATLFTGDFSRDGGYYQGRRAVQRNPVFNFKLNPDYTEDVEVSDIRELLYRTFFEPNETSDAVQVVLIDDRKPDRYFLGYTEKIETDIFSSDMVAQVSMLCTDPYLWSVVETTDSDEDGWISLPLTYDGSADTGMEIDLEVAINTSVIKVVLNEQTMTLLGTFVIGDVITINTNYGTRWIRQNGTDIMAALTADSKWIRLAKPANVLQTYAVTELDGVAKIKSYTYRSAWWGV